jgi:L-rhamnose mutarotase
MPEQNTTRVRKLYRRRLRPCKVAAYCELHKSIESELEQLYKAHGLTSISSFLHGNDLCVFIEYDPVLYERCRAQLEEHPLEQEWQARMAELDELCWVAIAYEEVYRMPPLP